MIDVSKYREQLDKAWSMLQALCHGRVQWHMSIPAKPDSDPDLILADGIHAGKQILEELIKAHERIKELEKLRLAYVELHKEYKMLVKNL